MTDLRVVLREIGADVATQHAERQFRRTRRVGRRHTGVAVLVPGERPRPRLFDSIAQTVQGTHSGVAAPAEGELLHQAHADQLVVHQIRRHAYQMQIADALTNDLVARGEGNEMRETLHCEHLPGLHVTRDHLAQ